MNTITARTVGEAMTRGLVTVSENAKIQVAAQLMDAYRLHGLLVVDTDHKVVGVLSQTDLLRIRTFDDWWRLEDMEVSNVMTAPAITISVNSSLDEAAKVMKGRRVHRLVVVGSDGVSPVGVLSVSDLVHGMAGEDGQR